MKAELPSAKVRGGEAPTADVGFSPEGGHVAQLAIEAVSSLSYPYRFLPKPNLLNNWCAQPFQA